MPAGLPSLHNSSAQDASNVANLEQYDLTEKVLSPSNGVAKAPQSLREQLSSNPFLTAGAGLLGLTAALALARKSFTVASQNLVQHYLVTLEIPIYDPSFPWFLEWMQNYQRTLALSRSTVHTSASQTTRVPTVSFLKSPVNWTLDRFRPRLHHLSVATIVDKLPNGSLSTSFSLFPGIGNHIFRYQSAFIKMSRSREMKNLDPKGLPWEVISLTTLYSKRHLFPELLKEAQHLAMESQEGKTVIYTSHMTSWKPFGNPRKKRPLESVVLDEGVKETILNDVHDFLGSSKWYTDRGIPYRRGYLLHGPPGSGKSSFIQALAGELDYNICIVNLSERGLTDDRLNHLLTNIPIRSLVLLEDVDAAFANRRQADDTGYAGANVTFSGLLNALDGVASSEERICFLTTNHPDRLDQALIRPGRVDMDMHLGSASEWQVGQMFDRFYADDKRVEKLRDDFVKVLRDAGAFKDQERGISTAQLQGLFVYFKRSAEEAVKNATSLMPKR